MNSQEQQSKQPSPTKQADDQGKAEPSPKPFQPLLAQLREKQVREEERKRRKTLKAARGKAQREFKAWKNTLCGIIQKDSELEFDEATLSWTCIIPPKLNQFFYEVMIREYVRMKKAPDKATAAVLVRQEFNAVAEESIAAELAEGSTVGIKSEGQFEDEERE